MAILPLHDTGESSTNWAQQKAQERLFFGKSTGRDKTLFGDYHLNFRNRNDIQFNDPERGIPEFSSNPLAKNSISDPEKTTSPEICKKMGTFDGVFIPTTLNVLSILMFLRFGFILGQTGVFCMLALLIISYSIDLLTTLSISAISTNGVVRGGGAYYMISRSLGPEFGGSIGVVFYIGQVLNSGMNVVGFCEPLLYNLGRQTGVIANWLPVGKWWQFTYATGLLIFCTAICMVGSAVFAKTGRFLFWILLLSTLSIPLSTILVSPFYIPSVDVWYRGLSLATLRDNLWPRFTTGAAGSLLPLGQVENFQNMFGIFFPATAGIFAGASMSGDLVKPSKSIPKGTLWGLLLTFTSYSIVILAMGASIPRDLLYSDVQVIQRVNLSKYIILMGELSTSLFSSIVGIVGSAKLLEAIAKDDIIPGLGIFANNKPKPQEGGESKESSTDKAETEPYLAILVTYVIAQITLFFDINAIAGFITMAFLMTFIVTNMACFLLKIASAPNFRPSFRFFSWKTALYGGLFGISAMFFADGQKAFGMLIVLIVLFIFIHYISPPKPWGDVSQGLIYHQVRKYLLRLRQDSVKFWRPQILLLVDDPRSAWNLIRFCNHLKKGGLYIMGHVVITDNFKEGYLEIKYQQERWTKLRDLAKAKAFIQIATGPDIIWSIRNLFLGSGLGGMRPNITVLGFFEMKNHTYHNKGKDCHLDHNQQFDSILGSPSVRSPSLAAPLPTDDCRKESSLSVTKWVHIIEDLLIMQANIAVARGFSRLELPLSKPSKTDPVKYIDLYPIQMSSQYINEDGAAGDILATNFDTYTLILQMGAILNTVPSWKNSHTLRVIVFVEFKDDVEDERSRIKDLLENLRIKAEVLVECLSCGKFKNYETIINGADQESQRVDTFLKDETWWQDLKMVRKKISDNQRSSLQIPINSKDHTLSIIPTNIAETILPPNSFAPTSSFSNRAEYGSNESLTSGSADESTTEIHPLNSISFSNTGGPNLHRVLGVKNRRLSVSQANAINIAQRRHTFSTPAVAPVIKKVMSGENHILAHRAQTLATLENPVDETTSLLKAFKKDAAPPKTTPIKPPSNIGPNLQDRFPLSSQPLSKLPSEATTSLKTTTIKPPFIIEPNLQDRFPFSSQPPSRLSSGATTPKLGRMKPNFSSLAIPHMRFLQNDTDDSTKSTIAFEDNSEKKKKIGLESRRHDIIYDAATLTAAAVSDNIKSNRHIFTGISTSSSSTSVSSTTSTHDQAIVDDDDDDDNNRNDEDNDHNDDDDDDESCDSPRRPVDLNNFSDYNWQEVSYLSFNDIPARAQHLILNDLMTSTSRLGQTDVIFSTLPAPTLGTHLSEEESLEYVESLELWCQNLPPVMLVHSQTMTVTTAL